ncbi:MAG: hypothetical protein Q7S40_21865 [Opitutaceae bacterium]|nr:hypothetical protein [Opitutaceae bacterium]
MAASPDGTWIELAALTGRPVPRLELGPEKTGGWLKPGDVVELEIERVGILRTRIVAPPRVA